MAEAFVNDPVVFSTLLGAVPGTTRRFLKYFLRGHRIDIFINSSGRSLRPPMSSPESHQY